MYKVSVGDKLVANEVGESGHPAAGWELAGVSPSAISIDNVVMATLDSNEELYLFPCFLKRINYTEVKYDTQTCLQVDY